MVTRHKIGVQMRFDNMLYANVMLTCGGNVEIHIALWIDHCRHPIRADQIRCLRQAPEIELLEDHTRLSGRALGRVQGLGDHT